MLLLKVVDFEWRVRGELTKVGFSSLAHFLSNDFQNVTNGCLAKAE